MDEDVPVTPPTHLVRRYVLVWDVPTRLFHWFVVALVASAYATLKLNLLDWHARIGESLLTLLIFRLLWGCFGSETARFRRFIASPIAVIRHLRHLFRRDEDTQVGHNAAGGWMVLVLFTLLLIETLSGLYVNNDIANAGPLSEIVPAWLANAVLSAHALGWELLVAAASMHVLVIMFYAVVKGHNLLRPMLSGYKWLPSSVAPPQQKSTWLALALLAASVFAVMLLTTYI